MVTQSGNGGAKKLLSWAWTQAGFAGLLILVLCAVIWYQARESGCRETDVKKEREFFIDLQLKQYDQLRQKNDQLTNLLTNNTAALTGITNAVTRLDESIRDLKITIREDNNGRK